MLISFTNEKHWVNNPHHLHFEPQKNKSVGKADGFLFCIGNSQKETHKKKAAHFQMHGLTIKGFFYRPDLIPSLFMR